ncbi:MAG: hypothetical protein WC977_14865 [Anaerovoracaceae bacterium]|jgi:hypothetical protein
MQQRHTRLSGVDGIQARPPRVGKLKIGEVKTTVKNGREISYPSKLDWICAKDGAGNIVQSFHDVYGEKPVEFMAVFPSNDPTDFYWEAYRRYGSGTGLVCHGDGRQAIVEETGETIECPCPFAEPTVRDGKEYPPACKVVASCSLWLYEVPELGVFQIDTGGFRSVANMKWFIRTGLPGLSGGQLAGIPIRVYVEPFQAVHDGKASTAYQWKFGLAPGMKPADVRVAAADAVEGFCLPQDIGPRLLDEAKPQDLYPGVVEADPDSEIPGVVCERPDDAEPGECIGTAIPEAAVAAEETYAKALLDSPWPKAKRDSKLELMRVNRGKAAEDGAWGRYVDWLNMSIEQVPGGAS